MDLIIKVVICMDSNAFGVELAFNLLQRRVFADGKLILCLLTRDVDGVKEMAAPVEKCCFSNMIGKMYFYNNSLTLLWFLITKVYYIGRECLGNVYIEGGGSLELPNQLLDEGRRKRVFFLCFTVILKY